VISIVVPKPIWVLYLNDMRHAHVEDLQPVLRASSREELEAILLRERVENYIEPGFGPYGETNWEKYYCKGGPLEWFNPPDSYHPSFRKCDFEAVVNDLIQEILEIPMAEQK
jgi:hypothetical protein